MTKQVGTKNGRYRKELTPRMRAAIRRSKRPAMELAREYDVHVMTIYRIQRT